MHWKTWLLKIIKNYPQGEHIRLTFENLKFSFPRSVSCCQSSPQTTDTYTQKKRKKQTTPGRIQTPYSLRNACSPSTRKMPRLTQDILWLGKALQRTGEVIRKLIAPGTNSLQSPSLHLPSISPRVCWSSCDLTHSAPRQQKRTSTKANGVIHFNNSSQLRKKMDELRCQRKIKVANITTTRQRPEQKLLL